MHENTDRTILFRDVARFVWRYMARRPWMLTFLAPLLIIQAAAELVLPFIAGELLDYVGTAALADEAFVGALPLVGLVLLSSAVYHFTQFTAHYIYDRYLKLPAMRDAAHDAFANVQRFSTDWHNNTFAGATVTKIKRGMGNFETFVDSFYINFIPLTLVIGGVIIFLALRFQTLGFLFVLVSILYTALSIWMAMRFVAPLSRQVADQDSRTGAAFADSISCNATVKMFGRELIEVSRLGRVVERWYQLSWLRYFMGNVVGLIQSLIIGVGVKGLLFVWVIWLWAQGAATVGDVAFIIATYNLIQAHLKGIGHHIRVLQMSVNDMEDIVRFSLMEPNIEDTPHAQQLTVSTGTIAFDTVTFSYPGQASGGFSDLSVEIPAGQRVALVGHSGAGKSTFVKLIQRLHDLDAGQILVDGQDISQVTQQSLRRNVALVPQEPILFHRSLAENIAYGKPRASRKEIEKAAKAAHAHEFIAKLPQGYDTLVGERGVKLSGGERQRVAIARAMLADSPILILDEATSALDSESEGYIQDALEKLMQGRTSIVVAHRLSTIRSVDRILVFEGGKIVEDGTHTQLLKKRGGIYKKLYQLQQGGYLAE